MSDLRKMARDAGFNVEFDDYVIDHWKRFEKLAELIKDAALAQPEPIPGATPMAEYAAKSAAVPGRAEALKQAGYTRRPRQLQKEDEPVAWNWVLDGKDYGPVYYGKPPDADITKQAEQGGRTVRFLYTTPPQRKPLTDDQIAQIDWKDGETLHDFARAIEKAHGIE